MEHGTFDRLPDEIMVEIASLLDGRDVAKLEQTSRRHRKLFQSDPVWRRLYRRDYRYSVKPPDRTYKEAWIDRTYNVLVTKTELEGLVDVLYDKVESDPMYASLKPHRLDPRPPVRLDWFLSGMPREREDEIRIDYRHRWRRGGFVVRDDAIYFSDDRIEIYGEDFLFLVFGFVVKHRSQEAFLTEVDDRACVLFDLIREYVPTLEAVDCIPTPVPLRPDEPVYDPNDVAYRDFFEVYRWWKAAITIDRDALYVLYPDAAEHITWSLVTHRRRGRVVPIPEYDGARNMLEGLERRRKELDRRL